MFTFLQRAIPLYPARVQLRHARECNLMVLQTSTISVDGWMDGMTRYNSRLCAFERYASPSPRAKC